MCYSAMVRRDLERIAREFGASIDFEAFVKLYAQRASDPKLKIPAGMDEFFLQTGGAAGRAIGQSIASFQDHERRRQQQELSDCEAEIAEIQSRLKIKPTKTQQKALEAKIRKREKLVTPPPADPEGGYRIYPFYFAPVIIHHNNRRLVTPMRYRVLPSTGVEIPPKYNVFNARRDSLLTTRTWRELFGKSHAIFPFVHFYEWISRLGKKLEICFAPEGFDGMWAASLFETAGPIRSFAMVTDEPPPEVAEAGHDRCPVFLNHLKLEAWLKPAGQPLAQLQQLLDAREPTHYSHQVAA